MITPKTFILAGNATFTVESLRTGKHFTFKVIKPSDIKPHFVRVLTGSDNESDYEFLGTIFPDGSYRHSTKSRINLNAPSAKAFNWLWHHIDNLPLDQVTFHHEGRCCRCGRTLTVPESIESGIGPECANKMGI